jgi:hypothetical protein
LICGQRKSDHGDTPILVEHRTSLGNDIDIDQLPGAMKAATREREQRTDISADAQ